MRTYLVRMAGKWTSGARQQKLRVPEHFTMLNGMHGSLLERPGSFVSLQYLRCDSQIQGEVRPCARRISHNDDLMEGEKPL